MFEKDLPGRNTAGFNADSKIGELPLETCDTINGAWGYNKNDKRFKSTGDLIQYLARAASNNANFLLNVGPMPNGQIQPEFQTRLREMGEWLSKYGESIYGTKGGPITARPWGVSTQKGDRVYLHVFDWQEKFLAIPKLSRKIRGASLLNRQLPVMHREFDGEQFLQLPPGVRDPFDTVVAIDLWPEKQ
jgi:alpha-L-fucosidase